MAVTGVNSLLSPAALGLASAVILLVCVVALYLRRRPATNGAGGHKAPVALDSDAVEEGSGPPKRRAKLLYGTQTGTAERFSKQLKGELQAKYGGDTVFEVKDLEEYKAEEQLANETLVFFLMATYGDGEPTDNASHFYSWLLKAASSGEEGCRLKGTSFAVFALGNRQYEHFCAVGNKVHTALLELGAQPVVNVGEGDDDEDIEADFDGWKADLFACLDDSFLVSKSQPTNGTSLTASDTIPSYDVTVLTGEQAAAVCADERGNAPVLAAPAGATREVVYGRVLVNRELHTPASDRSCLHVELDIAGSGLTYEAGDHVGILPDNDAAWVEEAAQALGHPLDTVFSLSIPAGNPNDLSIPFQGPLTLRRALSQHCDLLGPITKQALQAFAAHAQGEDQKRLLHLLSPEGSAEHKAWHQQSRCVLELMREFPHVQPPLGAVFGAIIPRLQTRFYSISSSPLAYPTSVHVTCAYVDEVTPTGRRHVGVCSQYLKRLQVGSYVPLFIRRSTFRLPTEQTQPVVMVGPGTGLAPFRGFLQQLSALRAQGQQIGPVLLYTGCRRKAHDYIYERELEGFQQDGTLQLLSIAFSRDTADKVYVQMHMRRDAANLAQLLGQQQGCLYVCGDAKHMAKDVHQTLLGLYQQQLGQSEADAEASVREMGEQGRYQKDVW